MSTPLVDDARLDREFAYTTWAGSCKALYGMDAESNMRCCRRPAGHADEHASGFGSRRLRWREETS